MALEAAVQKFTRDYKVSFWQPVPDCMLLLTNKSVKGILGRSYLGGYLGSTLTELQTMFEVTISSDPDEGSRPASPATEDRDADPVTLAVPGYVDPEYTGKPVAPAPMESSSSEEKGLKVS